MRRAGKIGLATSAVVAAGVVTGGMLAVGQQLNVADDPGRQLTLQGVETGVAAQDSSGVVSGARIRAEGTTPKVEDPVVVEQPVVNEVPPSDPVVIAPRRSAPAPAAPAAPPAPKQDGHQWGNGNRWGEAPQPQAPKPEPQKPEPQKPKAPQGPQHGGGGGGHGGGHGPGPH
jgi:hypothetical protein